jgi:hypothetical protein
MLYVYIVENNDKIPPRGNITPIIASKKSADKLPNKLTGARNKTMINICTLYPKLSKLWRSFLP